MFNRGNFFRAGAALAVAVVLGPANTASAEEISRIDLNALQLKDVGPLPGVSSAFVQGAFNAPGLYAARSVMKAGSVFPPHRHPDIRMTVVTSGTMYLAKGEAPAAADFVAYPVGTVAITPAGMPHAMEARDGDVAVLEIGSGPSATEFQAE